MILLLKKIRQRMIRKNQFPIYLAYAAGEILLGVIGILIAIQIDDWNRGKQLAQEELDSYKLIIYDLKRDSILFERYHRNYLGFLNDYFKMNNIQEGKGSFASVMPDYLVSNIQFNPSTQRNHQVTIEKLRKGEIREQINNYFANLNQVHLATEEFNEFITEESRPYFLKEQNVLKNSAVFDDADKTFPPFRGVSAIDTVKLRETISHRYFLPILSQLRMSIGFYLANLERSMEQNHQLIQELEMNLE
jgi:hypothetical protein